MLRIGLINAGNSIKKLVIYKEKKPNHFDLLIPKWFVSKSMTAREKQIPTGKRGKINLERYRLVLTAQQLVGRVELETSIQLKGCLKFASQARARTYKDRLFFSLDK